MIKNTHINALRTEVKALRNACDVVLGLLDEAVDSVDSGSRARHNRKGKRVQVFAAKYEKGSITKPGKQ